MNRETNDKEKTTNRQQGRSRELVVIFFFRSSSQQQLQVFIGSLFNVCTFQLTAVYLN
jgi:hypothetical protein